MTTYAIQRTIGNSHDFLHAWDDEWGTACMRSITKAMTFATLAEAEAAADRAQRECLGVDRQPTKIAKFSVFPIPGDDEHPDDDRAQRAEQTAEVGTEAMAVAIAQASAPVRALEGWRNAIEECFGVSTEPAPAVEFTSWRTRLAGILGESETMRQNGTAFELFGQGLTPHQAAQKMVDQACADGQRFTAKQSSQCPRSTTLWLVMDASLQRDVFHWYGDTGQAKCEAVAAALNALGHGKD